MAGISRFGGALLAILLVATALLTQPSGADSTRPPIGHRPLTEQSSKFDMIELQSQGCQSTGYGSRKVFRYRVRNNTQQNRQYTLYQRLPGASTPYASTTTAAPPGTPGVNNYEQRIMVYSQEVWTFREGTDPNGLVIWKASFEQFCF